MQGRGGGGRKGRERRERKREQGGEEENEEEEEERGREEEGRQGGGGEDGDSVSAVDQAWGPHLLSFEGHSWEDTPLTFPWPHRAKGTPTGEVEEGVIKIKLKKIFFKVGRTNYLETKQKISVTHRALF